MSLPVVLLARSGVLRLREGHPWIFPDHVERADATEAGLVRLEGPAGRPRGFAVWNPRSRIPLRVIARAAPRAATHAATHAAAEDEPGERWWQERLDAAITARATALAPGEAACRWVHAEADGLPGLVIDRYADVAVLQAGCEGADKLAPAVAEHLLAAHGVRGVLARHDGGFRKPEGLPAGITVLAGDVPRAVTWESAGVRRTIDPWTGQKTGTYLDQRENQRLAPALLRAGPGARCLDAFCNDGGFALHLARGGSHVVALDGSEAALGQLAQNAADNALSERIEARKVNVFEHLRELAAGGPAFDGIVLDPPALARRKAELPQALRGYKELNLRALALLRPGGRLLTCSCSFHVGAEAFLEMLRAAAADAGRDVRIVELRGAAPCHPRRLLFPESAYLKVALLEVTGTW
jgi:23S rRNA (cytosine1962-C5)-methyltransferase